MIDLHLHLDGSLSYKTIKQLASASQISLPDSEQETMSLFKAPKKCRDLNEYLRAFELPLLLLQSAEALETAVYNLLFELNSIGIRYAEIRFAPQLHTKNGLSQYQAVQSAAKGLFRAVDELQIDSRLILCCMRGDSNQTENKTTVEIARELINNPVAAIDLAGAEGLFHTQMFSYVFELAQKLCVPYTIHAGEADGPSSVLTAINMGASRIGHGVRSIEDESLLDLLSKKQIPLELCPSSNLQTGIFKSIEQFPLRTFLKKNINVTINTDNLTVSDTTLKDEFDILTRGLELTNLERMALLKNSIDASFTDRKVKKSLHKIVENILIDD